MNELDSPADYAHFATDGRWQHHPHVTLINHHLMRAARGEVKRLLITVPPQHGKSTLCSQYFPAWYLIKHPQRRVILASYEADFASQWGRRVRNLLEDEDTNFGIRVSKDSSAAARWDLEIEDPKGGMQTAGAGGPITGKTAHVLIIDDPFKNSQDAASEVIRQNVYEWYLSTALTRVSDDGVVILIQTRWHEDDLAGRLLKDAEAVDEEGRPKGEKWEHVNLPAIAEEDEVWPTAWTRKKGEPLSPKQFTLTTLQSRERALGPYFWAALYQQRPVPMGGAIFKRPWFRPWRMSKENPGHISVMDGQYNFELSKAFRFCTVDPAISDAEIGEKKAADPDYTVIAAWAAIWTHKRTALVLLDLIRERMEGPDILPKMQAMHKHWKFSVIGVETIAFQAMLFQYAKRYGLPVREICTRDDDDVLYRIDKDKLSRAISATPLMADGRFHIPEYAPWMGDYLNEMLNFPRSAHDDQVDVTAFAVAIAEKYVDAFGAFDQERGDARPIQRESRALQDIPQSPMSRFFGAKPSHL